MSAVIARFYVSEVAQRASDRGGATVTLAAVSRGPENKEWARATPHGQIVMTIKNGAAAAFFTDRLGQDIEVRFDAHQDDAARLDPYGQ